MRHPAADGGRGAPERSPRLGHLQVHACNMPTTLLYMVVTSVCLCGLGTSCPQAEGPAALHRRTCAGVELTRIQELQVWHDFPDLPWYRPVRQM